MNAPQYNGYANDEDRTWALIASFGGIIFWFLAPLVAFVARGGQSPTVRQHAIAALNYQIPATIISVVLSICVTCGGALFGHWYLGWCLGILVWLANAAICVMAGLKANVGQVPTYPINLGIIK